MPRELEPGQWLLPAPLTHRHNPDDPTALFDTMETPGANLRIGLAHGSIRDFSSRGEAQNQIAPDRAQRSGLDYLALGDWQREPSGRCAHLVLRHTGKPTASSATSRLCAPRDA